MHGGAAGAAGFAYAAGAAGGSGSDATDDEDGGAREEMDGDDGLQELPMFHDQPYQASRTPPPPTTRPPKLASEWDASRPFAPEEIFSIRTRPRNGKPGPVVKISRSVVEVYRGIQSLKGLAAIFQVSATSMKKFLRKVGIERWAQ